MQKINALRRHGTPVEEPVRLICPSYRGASKETLTVFHLTRTLPHPCARLPRWVKRLSIPIATLIFVLFAGAAFPAPAAQRPSTNRDERAVADFYRGKVVRIVVGFPPGGGADVYSRILARYLGHSIPGNPTVAVTNMPGAGSIIAGNHIFNAGATDGTEIGMLNGAVILEQLFGNPAVQFDMARFRYLAVPITEIYVMIVTRRSGITRFSELIGAKAKQAVLAPFPIRPWSMRRSCCAML